MKTPILVDLRKIYATFATFAWAGGAMARVRERSELTGQVIGRAVRS
jgi:hypothetical protein